jgi:hypothetical protein
MSGWHPAHARKAKKPRQKKLRVPRLAANAQAGLKAISSLVHVVSRMKIVRAALRAVQKDVPTGQLVVRKDVRQTVPRVVKVISSRVHAVSAMVISAAKKVARIVRAVMKVVPRAGQRVAAHVRKVAMIGSRNAVRASASAPS